LCGSGELPGFTLARQKQHGWIPTFFNATNGAEVGRGGPHTGGKGYTTLDTGLNTQGVLFARTYFLRTAGRDDRVTQRSMTAEIARLAKKLFHMVRFEHLLCDVVSSHQDDQGTAPPFTFDDVGGCGALQRLQPDGAYQCDHPQPHQRKTTELIQLVCLYIRSLCMQMPRHGDSIIAVVHGPVHTGWLIAALD
jgi:hypothetical protein